MLTPGNRKLGLGNIWAFSLPSGSDGTCPGRTIQCSRYCYARRMEILRPNVHRAYRRNLQLTKQRHFIRRMYHYIRAMRIRTVRIHVGGDFYSEEYARKWLRIIKLNPRTRFYFYSRSWKDPPIRAILEQMSEQSNCQAWFSCDQETGIPEGMKPSVRLAWLQVDRVESISTEVDLVFRRHGLRKLMLPVIDSKVCPEQDGVVRSKPVTCDQCQLCIRHDMKSLTVTHC